MAMRSLTSAAAVGLAAGSINLSIQDCNKGSTHGHVSGIVPSSVAQGRKTTVTGSGNVDITVTDGSFDLEVKALGVTVTSCKGNLCAPSQCSLPFFAGSINYNGLSCPVAAGHVDLALDVTVSNFIPSSLAVLEVGLSSSGSQGELLCAKLHTSPGLGFNNDEWEAYKQQFGKVYNGAEDDAKRAQFYSTLQTVEEQKAKGESLEFGINVGSVPNTNSSGKVDWPVKGEPCKWHAPDEYTMQCYGECKAGYICTSGGRYGDECACWRNSDAVV